jgi:poly(hydroxyalkanoate) granule-associated protein
MVTSKESSMADKKKGRSAGGLYSANQIWSAGLGAMSRAQTGSTKFFEELVREGSRLQGGAIDAAQKMVLNAVQGAQKSVNRKVDNVKGQATETWDSLEKIFQARVQRALHQLGMPTAEEIAALARQVNALNRSVEQLTRAQGKSGKPAGRKKTARSRAK